jgi:cholesterol oxidase
MALLDGMQGVRQLVASQLTTHPVVDTLGKIKSGFRLDAMLGAFGAQGVTTHAGGSPLASTIDRAIALYPMPEEWAGLGPVSRRMFAIYGPVFKPANLNRATHDALGEIFGFANLAAFAQISTILSKGHVVDAQGQDRYLPHVKRLAFPIVLLHGADNAFFLPEGSARTFEWLRAHNGPDAYRRHVIPGYGHLDCFIGTQAAKDVFPIILSELESFADRGGSPSDGA